MTLAREFKTLLATDRITALTGLNQTLSPKTFVALNRLSLADLVLYDALYNNPFRFTERLQFGNVVRYFDLVQHTVAVMVPELHLRVVEFELETPFVPTVAVETKKKDSPVSAKPDVKSPETVTPTSKQSKPAKEKKEVKKETVATESSDPAAGLSLLDIRVGTIVAVERHPDAETLYVEQVDVGEEKPRTVVSGLVKYLKEEDLLNKQVVLLCNLKPAKMRGVESQAMVLAASNPEGVLELLKPTLGSKNGEVAYFEGYPAKPEGLLNPKKKIWETLQPHLAIIESHAAVYSNNDKVYTLKTASGPITVASLTTASIK